MRAYNRLNIWKCVVEKFPKLMANTKPQFHNAQRLSKAIRNKNKMKTTKNSYKCFFKSGKTKMKGNSENKLEK